MMNHFVQILEQFDEDLNQTIESFAPQI